MKPILLLQFQRGETSRQIETASVLASGHLQPDELVIIRPDDEPATFGLLDEIRGLIIGGGGVRTTDAPIRHYDAAIGFIKEARKRGLPILGVCFGAQLLARIFNGWVEADEANAEHGTFDFELADTVPTGRQATDPLFAGLPHSFPIQCWHRARVTRLPEGAKLLGSSARCPIQAFTFPGEKIWGTQFHPERTPESFEPLLRLHVESGSITPEAAADIRRTLRPSPDAASLVARFVELAK